MEAKQNRPKKWWRYVLIPVGVLAVLIVVAYLALGSCSDVPAPSLSYPADASREDQVQFVMDKFIVHEGCTPVHNFAVYVENEPAGIAINEAAGIQGRSDMPLEVDYQYRVASITKTVVATVILQLMEEGQLSLDDHAATYLADIDYLRWEELHLLDGVSHADEITIDQLLQHRSGLGDIFIDTETRFNASVLSHPKRLYTVERVFDTYYRYGVNETPHFAPGEGYFYSDTNYMLLGLIIEQVTGDSLPEAIRARVLEPLAMDNTYFEFYEAEHGTGKRQDSYLAFINIDKGIYTSHEWAGGGLVSTTEDMATFIKALFAGEFFEDDATLELMLDNSENAAEGATYARGINHYEVIGESFYGHGGYYGSVLVHNPEQGVTFSAHMGQVANPYSEDQIVGMVHTMLEIVEAEAVVSTR